MDNEALTRIDVDAIIKQRTTKKVPQFVVNYIKRLIHQDEINNFLYEKRNITGYSYFQEILDFIGCNDQLNGKENIAELDGDTPIIFAANHPLGALEAMVLGKHLGKMFNQNINFVVNDMLMHLTALSEFFTPVNNTSTKQMKNKDALGRLDELFASQKHVIMFPAGSCSRRFGNIITDRPWKKTFVTMARRHNRIIVPIFVSGTNSKRFYRIAKLRERIGIKYGAELILLPDEMFRKRGKTIEVTIGKPILPNEIQDTRSDKEWCDEIRKRIYSIGTTNK